MSCVVGITSLNNGQLDTDYFSVRDFEQGVELVYNHVKKNWHRYLPATGPDPENDYPAIEDIDQTEAIDRYFATFEDEGAGAGIKCTDGTEALWGMFFIDQLEGRLTGNISDKLDEALGLI